MTDIKDRVFFHGTEATFARKLLGSNDAVIFPLEQAREFTVKILEFLYDYVSEERRQQEQLLWYTEIFRDSGYVNFADSLIKFTGSEKDNLFAFGSMYITLSNFHALRYACGNKGSECLYMIEQCMGALEFKKDMRAKGLLSEYPDLRDLFDTRNNAKPVMLEMTGVNLSQLSNEYGGEVGLKYFKTIDEVMIAKGILHNHHPTFRLRSFDSSLVTAVYPLSEEVCRGVMQDWTLVSDFEALRVGPKEWLSQ